MWVFLIAPLLLVGCGTGRPPVGAPRVQKTAWGWQVSGLRGVAPSNPWYGFGPRRHHLLLLANQGLWQVNLASGDVRLLARMTSPGLRGLLGVNAQGIYLTQDSYRSPQPYTRVLVLPHGGSHTTTVATTADATPVDGPLWHGMAQGCGTLDPRTGTWQVPPLPPAVAPLAYCQPQGTGTALAFSYGGSPWAALIRQNGQKVIPLPLPGSVFRVNPFATPGPDVVLGIVGPGGAIPDNLQAFGSIPEANNLLLFDHSGRPLGATGFRSRFINNWWTGPNGTVYFSMARTSGFNPHTGTARTGSLYLGLLSPDGAVQVLGPAVAYAHPTLPPATRRQFLLFLLARGQMGLAAVAHGAPLGPVPWNGGYVYADWQTGTAGHFALRWWHAGTTRILGRFPGNRPGPFRADPPYLAFADGVQNTSLAVVRLPGRRA